MNRLPFFVCGFVVIYLACESSFAQKIRYSEYADNKKIEKNLSTKVKLEFEDVELRKILASMQDQAEIPIHLDQSAIDAGLGVRDICTIKFDGMTARSALRLFLNKYDCTYVIHSGVVEIMTREEADKKVLIRVYSCKDLVQKFEPRILEVPYFQGKRLDTSNLIDGKTAQAKAEGKKKLDETVKQNEKANGDQENGYFVFRKSLTPGQHLAHVITSSIEPNSWKDKGGTGSISEVNGVLIIQHNQLVHRRIQQMIDILKMELIEEDNANR